MEKVKLEFKMGVLIFFLIGFYFLLMEVLGLSDKMFLRFFNALFVMYGINRVIKTKVEEGENNYLSNLGSAIATSFIGIFISVVALWIYIGLYKGVGHMNELAGSFIIGGGHAVQLSQFCLGLLIEGLASSFILSFIVMQAWKDEKSIGIA